MCEDSIREGESFTSTPKIIFEVISKSTASHDYITKLDVYQRFGVKSYKNIYEIVKEKMKLTDAINLNCIMACNLRNASE